MPFFHPNFFMLLMWLVFGHYLADFPLQGYFLEKAKNPSTVEGKDIWPHALFAHCMIHAGFVLLFTGSIIAMVVQILTHGITDYWKIKNKLSFGFDQYVHLLVMIGTALIVSVFSALGVPII
jgi:hypothetical protein